MGLVKKFLTWWNGAEEPEPVAKPEPAKRPPRAIMRKYQQFRAALVLGDTDAVIRIQSILEKSGYPVPETLQDADLYIAKYGNRYQK